MPPTPSITNRPSTIAGISGPLRSELCDPADPGDADGWVAPPTAVGVEGGFPDPVAPAEDEALGDRRGLAVGARVAWADGRVVATGSGVGLGVALGVGAGVAVTVTCPAGRSATFPTDAAENDTLLRPTQVIDDLLKQRRMRGEGGEHPLAALSGPNIAAEIARYLPATAVAAADDGELARRVPTSRLRAGRWWVWPLVSWAQFSTPPPRTPAK